MTPNDPSRDAPPAAENNTAAGTSPQTAGAEAPNPNARVIKRYSNRKLYDTVESRYVTLPQIAELVRKGEDVRIIDNNTKEDLTSVTLAQILYEEERKQSRALPLAALKDLIHTSITSLRESPVGRLVGAKGTEGVEGAVPGATPAAGATPTPTPPVPAPPVTTAVVETNGNGNGGSVNGGDKPSERPGSPGRLAGMFESSKQSIEEWQHRVDERVRGVLESISPLSQMEKLQSEVRRLTQRLEELEARLGTGGKPGSGKDEGSRE